MVGGKKQNINKIIMPMCFSSLGNISPSFE